MGDPIPAPLIGEVASYIALAICIYVIAYAWVYRKKILGISQTIVEKKAQPTISKCSVDSKFYIEPSPIEGQSVVFPYINQPPEIALSVILPTRNLGTKVIDILEVLNHQLPLLNLEYEIIVSENYSEDRTADLAINYAKTHRVVRVLRIPKKVTPYNAACLGALHSRGQYIFIYYPDDNLSPRFIQQFTQYALNNLTDSIIIGNAHEDTSKFTNLASFLSFLHKWLWRFSGLSSNDSEHCSSFMITRSLAPILLGKHHCVSPKIEIEPLCVSLHERVQLTTFEIDDYHPEPISSWVRLNELIDLISCIFTYGFSSSRRLHRRRNRIKSE